MQMCWNGMQTDWNGMGYLETANESVCDEFLGVEHLYLHYLVKHFIRHLLEVVVQYLVCVCGGMVRGGGQMKANQQGMNRRRMMAS